MFDTFETESFRQNAFYKRPDFLKLAELYGIRPERAEKALHCFTSGLPDASNLIDRSFLSADAKRDVLRRLQDRLRAIAD